MLGRGGEGTRKTARATNPHRPLHYPGGSDGNESGPACGPDCSRTTQTQSGDMIKRTHYLKSCPDSLLRSPCIPFPSPISQIPIYPPPPYPPAPALGPVEMPRQGGIDPVRDSTIDMPRVGPPATPSSTKTLRALHNNRRVAGDASTIP